MKIAEACAVVSGGASGLGRAVVERVLADGGRCALLDVNDEQGNKAAAALGKRALFIRTDVSDEKSVNPAVEQARAAMGRITLAVSCAGILGAGRVLGKEGPMPGEQFIRTIQVNLVGTFLLTKAAAAAMQDNTPNEEGERGVIVNTASVAAFEGQIGQVAYSASKSGVAGMTLPIARELARLGIRVVTIAPGIFMTPMMGAVKDDFRGALAASVPFPSRLGRPEEFASLVAYIYGNTMLNGETIRLDGAIRMPPK
jgi:NAD(P)-dependent dehydrogenase (short-subunit alcohol dehydrogenase family)